MLLPFESSLSYILPLRERETRHEPARCALKIHRQGETIMAAGSAPALEPKNEKNQTEQTHLTEPNSFREWLVRKLDQIFEHNHEHGTYPGF